MPTQSEMRIPIPQSPDEFENICLDYIKLTNSNSYAQRYGRQGQNQHGIDIYVGNFEILVQCKRYYVSSVTNAFQKANDLKQQICADYCTAKKHFPNCQLFIAMTTFDKDTGIQDYVANIGTDIRVLFWDTIEDFLCANPQILAKYYPTFIGNTNAQNSIDIGMLNNMLSIPNNLKAFANKFYRLSNSNYAPFFSPYTDESVYNNYVAMYNHKVDLIKAYNQLAFQIRNTNIGTLVSIIDSFIPNGYQDDGMGSHLYVITDILRSFNTEERLQTFTKACDDLILEINNLNL
jgi:hypothetical protein